MRVDGIATWFEEGEAVKYLKDLKALIQGKKLIWMTERYGSIELHFENCVVTVKIEHVSFVEKVKGLKGPF